METVPAHLAVARSLVGKITDGPSILPLAEKIGEIYPDMAAYCRLVKPTTAWCGLFDGYCFAVTGTRPPYNPQVDVKSFLWARGWLADWGTPVARGQEQLGDILVFDLGGSSHVTFYNGQDGEYYKCLGGNQSNAANEQKYPKDQCVGIRRPPAAGAATAITLPSDVILHPMLQNGAIGSAVSELQALLGGGLEVDGEFGPDTDDAVRAFQAAYGLEVDGVVGPETWKALTTGASFTGLPQDIVNRIAALASDSALARAAWRDRGVAPRGYIKGLAVTFAKVYLDLKAGGSAARVMAALPAGNTDKDALAWYGITNITEGAATLRALFALLIGLGMRESSGKYYEGRDASASNITADTAEAGLFQQSFNSFAASTELPKLFAAYTASTSDGFLSIFRDGLSGSPGPGSGSGAQGLAFQALCKSKPAFAVECAAVGLRVLRQHWGPINRREAEIRPEADALLQQVQHVVDVSAKPPIVIPPPPPTGQPNMPPDGPTPFNPRVEECLQELRPILEKYLAPQSSGGMSSDDMRAELIRLLGGTPPALPAPKPPVIDPAPAPVQPATPAAPPSVLPGLAGGLSISALIGALMGTGTIGTPFEMGQAPTTAGTLAGIAALITPFLGAAGAGGTLLSVGRGLIGWLASKAAPAK